MQWAQNSVDLWRNAVQQPGSGAPSANEAKRHLEQVESRVQELLARLPLGQSRLSHSDGQIALACIRLLMFVEKPDSDLRPHIAKILASLDDPDMTIHLLLLQAQYNFDQATDKDAWMPPSEPRSSGTWTRRRRSPTVRTRIPTGSSCGACVWRVKQHSWNGKITRYPQPVAKARRAKGLSALGKLNQAIKSLEASSDPHAASDAVCLRYLLGELTREFLTDTRFKEKLPSKTCTELKSSALTALGAIRPDVWSARQSFLSSVSLPTVDWDWGFDELDIMFHADGSPTRADVATTLIRKIQAIPCN